ncbi:ribosomal protection-like ABC-F family protein [Paraliobacillus ryukyuensis]
MGRMSSHGFFVFYRVCWKQEEKHMILCSVHEISKMYGGNLVLDQINLDIKENQRMALVGRNGSGKTTLLRLIAGLEQPDNGKIHLKKDMRVGYLEQIPRVTDVESVYQVLTQAFSKLNDMRKELIKLEQELASVTDEIKLANQMKQYGLLQDQFALAGGYDMEYKIEQVANGLKLSNLLSHYFNDLSGGEKTKVGLAYILLQEPDLLLLDEPTNHLDVTAVEWLTQFVQHYHGTILMVSHDRYFLDDVATIILDLEDGEITSYPMNYSNFVAEKEKRMLIEFQAYQEQQKKIKKMKEAIKRLRQWANQANPPNEGLHKRARNMERALQRMEKINKPVLEHKKMNFVVQASDRSGKDVVQLTDVSKYFEHKLIFTDVTLDIDYQDRVAIVGDNGTGKSTLLKLILGELTPDEGTVKIGSNAKIGYLWQNMFTDNQTKTVLELFREEIAVTEGKARHILAQFMFYGPAVFQSVANLSGGEKMRLRLAQLMYKDINVLILDEPTNHLDIESREVIEDALTHFSGTIIGVSHDRYFLNQIFSKIYWVENHTVTYFPGDYTWAKQKRKQLQVEHAEKNALPKQVRNNNNTSITQKYKSEDNTLEMEVLEKQLETIEEQIANTNEPVELERLLKQKQELETYWEALIEQLP